jgi:hypothetical protein
MRLRDDLVKPEVYLKSFYSDDPEVLMRHFVNDLDELYIQHSFKMSSNAKVPRLTKEEQEIYDKAKVCANCKKEFRSMRKDGTKVRKVRHRDHVTNKFIGAWCSRCNIRNNFRYYKMIVVFYNFSGYDGHFIIKHATKFMHEDDPLSYSTQKIISMSSQKIKHFQYSKYMFVDRMRHLNSSLDKLVEVLNKSGHGFPIFKQVGLKEILRSKGIYPY